MAMYYSSVEHSYGLHVNGWEEVFGQDDVFDWECSTNILANYAALPPPTSSSDVVLEVQFEDTNSVAALYATDKNKNGSVVQPPPPSPQPQQPPCVGEEPLVNELYMNIGWSDDLFTEPQPPVSAEPLVNDLFTLDELLIEPAAVRFPQPRPARSIRRWTSEEHAQFLIGLKKYGKGDWISISRHCVKTKTAVQIASHAQKYYLRHANHRDAAASGKKKRKSIHDMTLQSITSSTYTSTAT